MKLTEEQKTFAAWLSLPKSQRKPRTQELLAIELDVNGMTLSRWKKLPAVQAEVDNTHIRKLKDRMGEIYDALVEHAINGKHPKYMEMVFQLEKGQFGKQQVDVNLSNQEVAAMSTEDLASKAFELLNKHNDDLGINKETFVAAVATQNVANN